MVVVVDWVAIMKALGNVAGSDEGRTYHHWTQQAPDSTDRLQVGHSPIDSVQLSPERQMAGSLGRQQRDLCPVSSHETFTRNKKTRPEDDLLPKQP